MKKQKLEINYRSCRLEELDSDEQELVRAAMQATVNSYAKYSHFNVGAAIRLADGKIVIGANQENAAFPSGLCAERTAIFAAQAQYPDQAILQLAIAARNPNGFLSSPITPCGACRQVMMEMEDRYGISLKIFLYGSEELYIIDSVKDMLPFSFIDKNMQG
ncbi:cytidine deaminase [Prevotella sp. A2931]|uniref:Cytidine deaminase n=1 Tax=Prevotella illustrans TaxID=2800387 RepID=A0ABS3M773_9BACT|nr:MULTISPECIES: cytidine deaminase [Prevotella]MBO1364046.1 cytidine deaminase [Prevotella illustrans]PTL27245.1 cytidine deaminase [Prevotella sp. oral taxon 820]